MTKTLNLHVSTETHLAMLKLAQSQNLTLDAWLTMQAERAIEVLEVEEAVGMVGASNESALDKDEATGST